MPTLTRGLLRSGVAALALTVTVGLAGCGSVPQGLPPTQQQSAPASTPDPSDQPTSAPESQTPEIKPVQFTPSVKHGATGVAVDTIVSVKAAEGTLTKVALTAVAKDKSGKSVTTKVAGSIKPDGSSWTAASRLDPAAKYQLVMTGKNASDGQATTTKSSFSTQNLTLDQQTFPTLFPGEGSTVGIGMPVILTFDLPIKDKAAFEKNLHVTSSPKQEGTWHWVSGTEVHFRPKEFWKPGTKVQVEANLNGVNAGGGIYGQYSRSTSFTIGRSVITKVNLKSKQATVHINGKLARTIPISGGKPGFTTRSGTKLIMAKLRHTKMASETIGIGKNNPEYYDLDVEYALRVTSSGEFLHAAPWNTGKFGRVNGSHGCVGMSTADARWLFETVNLGDPEITTGSDRGLEQGNGWSDWDISYADYAKGSAL